VAREYQLNPFRPPAELRIDYARELNEQQFAAVTAAPGPALVLAGAGAGKTRTLTFRVAWLLEHGIPADRILLLTFTNKAAREMMQRVADLVGGELNQLWGGTFHSIGMRILRRHADRLGYRQDFSIADREDAKDLLAACLADSGIDPKATRFPKTEILADIFSMAINLGCSVNSVLERDYDSFVPLAETIEQVRQRYLERKRTTGLMDFDDLLVLWHRLLEQHADLRDFYQRRFQFVLVDEYQDTNTLQGQLLDLLAGRHRNLMAVGDDAQSIYSWRGANFANILEFNRRFPDAQIFKIETNYRSTPEILAVANAAIAANTRQFPKALQPARRSGEKPVLVVCGEASEQAAFVAQRTCVCFTGPTSTRWNSSWSSPGGTSRSSLRAASGSSNRHTSRTSPPTSSSSPTRPTNWPSSGWPRCFPALAARVQTSFGMPSASGSPPRVLGQSRSRRLPRSPITTGASPRHQWPDRSFRWHPS
jgi:DNA helicase-2/ATP-dependent DNA helicase PcrA